MLLCVNANAAIDKTVIVEHFQINAIHRPSFELALPGGKGCNVARAARRLGQDAMVTGWVGGYAGQWIDAELQAEGIQTAFVHTRGESRACLSVLDPSSGTLTEIYERGRPVSAAEVQQFTQLLAEWLPKVQLAALSGSLPPGIPADFYAQVIGQASAAGVPTILDTSGEALRQGLAGSAPTYLKCNRAELAELIGEPLAQMEDVLRAARQLSQDWGMTVIVTLGAQGAAAAQPGAAWVVKAPRVQAVSAVGSGDAFTAGLACGLLAGQNLEAALRLAAAAGAANALKIGAGLLDSAEVNRLLEQVVITGV